MDNGIRKLSFSIFLIGFITQLEEDGVFVDTSHFELVDGFYLSRSIAFCGGEAGAKAVDFSELAGCFGGCRRHCDEDSGRDRRGKVSDRGEIGWASFGVWLEIG